MLNKKINQPLNILIVHNYYKIPGGEDSVVQNEKKLLQDHGNNVKLYVRNNSEIDSFTFLRKLCIPFTTLYSIKTFIDIRKIIKKEKIDIIHVHNTLCLISPSVYYGALSMRVPVVQTIHNFRLLCPSADFLRDGHICEECVDRGIFHSVKYSCYRSSKLQTFLSAFVIKTCRITGIFKKLHFICLTEFNKEKLLLLNKKNKMVDINKIFIKPNFVEYDLPPVPFSKRKNQVIFVGRLDKTKGIQNIFEAWKSIKNFDLIVCGTGPESDWCNDFIGKNHIDNIFMKGFLCKQDIFACISESKALILASQWYEGFPMAIAESFVCGTPVLGSRIGNIGILIEDGINGRLFDPYSPSDISRAVSSINDMTENVYRISQELYSSGANYKTLFEIYEKCLSRS